MSESITGKNVGRTLASHIRAYVANALASFAQRIEAIEQRQNANALTRADVRNEVDSALQRAPAPVAQFDINSVRPYLDSESARYALDFERRASDKLQSAMSNIREPADGKDGADGRDGNDGRDGSDGRDGRDGDPGVTISDIDFQVEDGGRVLRLCVRVGDEWLVKEAVTTMLIDRGVHRTGMQARAGDCVTYGGSSWVATRDTTDSPGSSDAWRLMIKRGRPGRDARDNNGGEA
jgi:integrin beta 3